MFTARKVSGASWLLLCLTLLVPLAPLQAMEMRANAPEEYVVKTGDTLRYIISEGTVQVLRLRSVAELAGILARDGHAPVLLSEMDQAIVQGAIDGGK